MAGEGGLLIERWRGVQRWVWLALALAAPALCLAQEPTPSDGVTTTAPAAGVPVAGAPAASVLGAGMPGAALPVPQRFGNAATGLTAPPAEYTRFGASVGMGESDNVTLSSTNPKSQTLAAANLFFDLIRTGSRLELNALGNFSDIKYLEHAYGNQVLGRFDGLGNLILWTHHLTWLVRDDYGDEQTNLVNPLTPANLQRVNVFATGPNLELRPTLASFIDLQALYSRSTYQHSPFDGKTGTGSVTVGHSFSNLSSLSLVGEVEQLRFDNRIVNRNYQLRDYYGRYSIRGARTAIDFRAGVSQTDDTGAWKSSPLVRLSLTRNVSPFSTVTLSGGRDYANAMGGFASLTSGAAGGIPIGPVTQTTANALHTYGNAGWEFHRLRTTFELTGGWERDQYGRQSLYDATRENLQLRLRRQLTPLLSASIMAGAYRSQYLNQGFTDNFGTVGAGLTYRPGKWVVIYGNYGHQFRRPRGGAASELGYDENRVFIMIGYYPHSSGTAAPGGGGGLGMPSMP